MLPINTAPTAGEQSATLRGRSVEHPFADDTNHETPKRIERIMQKYSKTLASWASILDEKTLEQARTTATMPFIYPHLALMPDAHLGLGATVGSGGLGKGNSSMTVVGPSSTAGISASSNL